MIPLPTEHDGTGPRLSLILSCGHSQRRRSSTVPQALRLRCPPCDGSYRCIQTAEFVDPPPAGLVWTDDLAAEPRLHPLIPNARFGRWIDPAGAIAQFVEHLPLAEVPPGLDDGFGHWLAGFIDGEGCFTIQSKEGRAHGCRFSLCLRLDDRSILEECRARTGLGGLAVRQPRVPGGRPQVTWTVAAHRDCDVLASILTLYPLRAKKSRDFALWKQALEEWRVMGRHIGGPGRWNGPFNQTVMRSLKQEMESTRRWKDPHAGS